MEKRVGGLNDHKELNGSFLFWRFFQMVIIHREEIIK